MIPSIKVLMMNSSRRRLEAQADKYAHIASNGLRVTKRSSQGVTLSWPENDMDVVTFSDSKVSCLDLETELDANGNWFIVQMKKMDDDDLSWKTIYKGYGLQCEVDELDSDSIILFRMKRNGDKYWGTEIIASTEPPQATGEDLSRAVEMNSEYLVTRILGNTPHSRLKKILAAHDKNGMTPLMVACHNGNQTIAKMLLSCGSNVNDTSTGTNRTPLMFACIVGKLNIVQLLDQYGCDWRLKDKSGCNALHHAINGGNMGIVRFAFAKVGPRHAFEADHCGWSPLMRAVITSDSLDIVKFLVGKGADPNEVDRTNNKSILMAAILSNKLSFVKFLLEWGADPLYQNYNGKNCYDLARGLGYKEIAKLIRQHMDTLQPNITKPSTLVIPTLSYNNNSNANNNNNNTSLSSRMNNLQVSATDLSTETDSTFPDNSQIENMDELPLDNSTKKKSKTEESKRIPQKKPAEPVKPLHSVSSALETQYLLRPNNVLGKSS